ncbi:hypothetical protein BGV40_14185 [Methanosarcina sp. Ant1]|nr:hypothetical protein BGV40_14185 [Methanosarcina sp. Ant1]
MLYAGKDNTIKADIKNIGTDSTSGFQTALYADGEIVSTASVSSLASGKSKTVEFNWKPASDGEKALQVYVDYTNKTKEICEVNNWNIPILAKIVDMNPPKLEIKSPEDGSLVDAGNVTISGTVEDTSRNLTVDVNGNKAMLSEGSWSVNVPVVSGSNLIAVCAVDGANNTANEFIVVNGRASFLHDFNKSSGSRNKEIVVDQTHEDFEKNQILVGPLYSVYKKFVEITGLSISSQDINNTSNTLQISQLKEKIMQAGSSRFCIVAGLISAVLFIKFRDQRKQR